MFSFSSFPINKSSEIESYFDFQTLVRYIQDHPKKELFPNLYKKRLEGKDRECKVIKQNNLPWLTPNAMVKKRLTKDPKDFENNFIQSSGYVFFDVDDIEGDVDEFKINVIKEYGHISSLITKSSTNRGISILVRIDHKITTNQEFLSIYDYLKSSYFSKLKLDDSVRVFGVAWFIPSDPKPHYNYDSIVEIPEEVSKGSSHVLIPTPLHTIHGMNLNSKRTKTKRAIKELDYCRVFDECKLLTEISFDGDYLISPTPILKIRFPNPIKDGQKRKVFRKVIHDFLELNPNASVSHVFAFIKHLNEYFAKPRMTDNLLEYVVRSQYDYIKGNDNYKNTSDKNLRCIHYQKGIVINKRDKVKMENRLRGILKGLSTHKKINNAIMYLISEHDGYTKTDIAEVLDISLSTVKRQMKVKKEDYEKRFDEFVLELENLIHISKSRLN